MVVDLDSIPARPEVPGPPARDGLALAPAGVMRSNMHPHCPALWVLREARPEVTAGSPSPAWAREVSSLRDSGPPVVPGGATFRRAPTQSPPV